MNKTDIIAELLNESLAPKINYTALTFIQAISDISNGKLQSTTIWLGHDNGMKISQSETNPSLVNIEMGPADAIAFLLALAGQKPQ